LSRVLRFRLALLVALAGANGLLDSLGGGRANDFAALVPAGERLLSRAWATAFSDPFVQVGPIALLWTGITSFAERVTSIDEAVILAVTVYVSFAVGAALIARLLYRDRGETAPPGVELAAGLATMVVGLCWTALASGQPFDVIVAVLWIFSARAACRGRTRVAGVFLGVAAAVKLLALLGLPLLLLAPSWRGRLLAVASFTIVAVGSYAPFVVTGDFHMLDYEWHVFTDAPVALFVEPGSPFGWQLRAVQAAVVLGGGAVVVQALRRSSEVVWAAPLVLTALRFATDPANYNYYWLGAQASAILGVALVVTRLAAWYRVAAVLAAGVLGLAVLLDSGWTEVARYGAVATLGWVAMKSATSRPARVEWPATTV